MKQCIELVTVGKMGIKFNFVLNPVRFKLTRLLLQFILALIGVLASERFQILLKNSQNLKKKKKKKKKKGRNLIYHKRMWKARQTKKQPKQQENKLQSKTNRYTIRKKVKGK